MSSRNEGMDTPSTLIVQQRIQKSLKGGFEHLQNFDAIGMDSECCSREPQGGSELIHARFFFLLNPIKRHFECSWHLKSVFEAWYEVWSLTYFFNHKNKNNNAVVKCILSFLTWQSDNWSGGSETTTIVYNNFILLYLWNVEEREKKLKHLEMLYLKYKT